MKTKRSSTKSPSKPERKPWKVGNPYGESPYWVPPYMDVELTKADMYTMDMNGVPNGFHSHIYTGSKVKLGGEFKRLNIDVDGLKEDLQNAIDEVIRKHTKLKTCSKPTTIVDDQDA